ncbi:MAG: F0F1 ATP synthase subunit A [Deltaproteobacteria bacterium]|uniref:ATP synthase subunit a n=1 Tax=Candidatus Zymogenus saltonus TaxID=2844893 RepID=A0A9D8KH17_9DELT|nr:F0F1 ATP synthase subunit A [Candidatus Zymogenus saltonus]
MEHPILFLGYLDKFLGLEEYPHVTYTWLIMIFLSFLAYFYMKRASIVPNPVQNVIELIILALGNLVRETMGEKGMAFMPLLVAEALFIFTANLVGVIPGFNSPTANLNTNAAMAVVVFFITHFVGAKMHGFKYIKQFIGPVWWLIPLMLPIEVISHLSRPLSLSVRLFGNIQGEDLVLLILLFLMPYIMPLPIMFLMLLTSALQTFVFVLLTMLYISGAMEEAH